MDQKLSEYALVLLSLCAEGAYVTEKAGSRPPLTEMRLPWINEGEAGRFRVSAPAVRWLKENGWIERGPQGFSYDPTYWITPTGREQLSIAYPTTGLWQCVRSYQEAGVGTVGRAPALPPGSRDIRSTPAGARLDQAARDSRFYGPEHVSPSATPGAIQASLDRDQRRLALYNDEPPPEDEGRWFFEDRRLKVDADGPPRVASAALETVEGVRHQAWGASFEEAAARAFVSIRRWAASRDAMVRAEEHARDHRPHLEGLPPLADSRQVVKMRALDYVDWAVVVKQEIPAAAEIQSILELVAGPHPARTATGAFSVALATEIDRRFPTSWNADLKRIRERDVHTEPLSLTQLRTLLEWAGILIPAEGRFEVSELGMKAIRNSRALAAISVWVLSLPDEKVNFFCLPGYFRSAILGEVLAAGELAVDDVLSWPDFQLGMAAFESSVWERFSPEEALLNEFENLQHRNLCTLSGQCIRPTPLAQEFLVPQAEGSAVTTA